MHSTTTLRLTLIPLDVPACEALSTGVDELSRYLNIHIPAVSDSEFGIETTYQYVYDKIKDNPEDSVWWAYLFVANQDHTLVGSGGYKGPPDEQGMVEIGYQIYEPYRGRGFATEAAQGLIDRAFEDSTVKVVQAHTLAEENASVRLLTKCGMIFVRAIDDPDDGPIWQWQLKRTGE